MIGAVANETSARSCGHVTAVLVREMAGLAPLSESYTLPNPLFREIWKACPGFVVEKPKLCEVHVAIDAETHS